MNVKLLRKVQKHILEEPERLHMPVFRAKRNDEFPVLHFGAAFKQERNFAKCGTAACIGGWVCLLSGEKYPDSNTAAKLLGDRFKEPL